MTPPLTDFQARAALHLARAHHHLWASLHDVSDEQLVAWLVAGDYAALSAACLAQGQGMPGGIDVRVADHDGVTVVEHATGTGRLSWHVWPDGVTLTVHRPEGAVLVCAGDADDWEDGRMWWSAPAGGDAPYVRDVLPRHLEAVEHALGYQCSDADLLLHVVASAWRELDRAREAHREAAERMVQAALDFAGFRHERRLGGAS